MSLLNNLGTYKTDGVERCHLTCLSPYGGLHFEGWALAGASMRFCQLLIIRAWTCKGEQCANWIKLRDVFCVLSLFFRIVPPSAPGPEAPSLAHSRKLDVNDSKFCSYSLIAYQMMISHWHILCIYIYIDIYIFPFQTSDVQVSAVNLQGCTSWLKLLQLFGRNVLLLHPRIKGQIDEARLRFIGSKKIKPDISRGRNAMWHKLVHSNCKILPKKKHTYTTHSLENYTRFQQSIKSISGRECVWNRLAKTPTAMTIAAPLSDNTTRLKMLNFDVSKKKRSNIFLIGFVKIIPKTILLGSDFRCIVHRLKTFV